jgi:hypothetical protein
LVGGRRSSGWSLRPPDEACADARPQALRDRWGAVLFDFLLRGPFQRM